MAVLTASPQPSHLLSSHDLGTWVPGHLGTWAPGDLAVCLPLTHPGDMYCSLLRDVYGGVECRGVECHVADALVAALAQYTNR